MTDRTELVLEIAHELGFDLAGVAPLEPPRRGSAFERWLEAGMHGSMEWLERERGRILDPVRLLPEGRSMLVVGLAHARAAVELPGGGRVARYAAGRDYHNVIGGKLKRLMRRLGREGLVGAKRKGTDAVPLLERSHAAVAGLGFESKAANLLHPDFGPWFFLGEVLLEDELEPTAAPAPGSCGTCRACIDACPTAAIVAPGTVDARRCISYHTIESAEPVPHALRPELGTWAFGCDVCSEVCPWGRDADDRAARFGTHPAIAEHGLVEWLELGPALAEELAGSPLQRAGRAGLARNAAIALGNAPQEGGRRALLHALSFDPSALVREAAAWGLERAHAGDAGVREAVEQALSREPDPAARAGMRRTLADG